MPKVNVFYAKFVPALGSMTIERENGTTDEGNSDRAFVYRITAADRTVCNGIGKMDSM